jgi:hypothetical protein
LQLGLQRLVERSQDWNVGLVEHAWTDPLSDDPKFIDLVAIGKSRPWRLVIEAKRSRNTAWIFLTGKRGASIKFDVQARAVSAEQSVDDWERTFFLPQSPSASFCVVRKNKQYSQELIEKTAAELVRASDALAAQETAISARAKVRAGQPSSQLLVRPDGVPAIRLYFPVIVTTAKLYAASGDYAETDLSGGDLLDIAGEEVPLVRFTKSLSVPHMGSSGLLRNSKLEDLGKFAMRTVMVVQARHFSRLLEDWQLKLDCAQSWLINCNLLS